MSVAERVRLQLHPAQARFLDSRANIRGFVGGRGAGKTFIGVYDLLKRAKPNRLYLASAPTYTMLKDGAWRTFRQLGETLRFITSLNRSDMRATLGNGAEVLFRSADEPDRLRGMNLSGAWLDEASIMSREVFEVVLASLREQGQQGWLSATFTPKGRQHWTYEVFGHPGADTELVHAASIDNPFIPESLIETVRAQYTSALAQQELGGEFVDLSGALFRRAWFSIVDTAPADCRKVRYWDLAATAAKAGTDPDFTAGPLLGVKDGIYYVLDLRRLRGTPLEVESLVKQTAETDGKLIPIWIEQEPGSSGVNTIDHYVRRVLPGWTVRGDRVTGNKIERMGPFASQAEAGNVRLVRAAWNGVFLDEAESIPFGAHDDILDSSAAAFQKLQRAGLPFGWIKLPEEATP